jgi:MarR family 2-MHQ and catechol resistance regulon transcriptional repressor
MGTRYEGTPAERRALDAYIKLRRAVNTVGRSEARVMQVAGVTESQFGVLEALLHLGPTCQRDLASKILKSAGNLTTVIDNLERRGLVERRRGGGDRRLVTVHLTDAGEDLIREVLPRNVAVIVEAFSVLSAEQQQQLAALCRTLGLRQSST